MSSDKSIADNSYPKKSTEDRQFQNQDEFDTQRPNTATPESDLIKNRTDSSLTDDRENEKQLRTDREVGADSES